MPDKNFFPRVRDVAHMGVIIVPSHTSVADAVSLMEQHNLSDVVFEGEQGHAIFTVDTLMLLRQHKRTLNLPLCDIATPRLHYVDGDESVLRLLSRFDHCNCRYLGVLDAARNLVGIVSHSDVLASVDPTLMMEHKKLNDVLHKRRLEMVDFDTPTETALASLNSVEDTVLVLKNSQLAGIVTTRDAIRMINDNVNTHEPIGWHMTHPVWTIRPNETIKSAIELIRAHHFKRAVVVDEHNCVLGVVTQRELVEVTYGRWAEMMKLHAHELGEMVQMLESANQELRRDTLTDPLTGVGNRRRINQVIEAEIGRYYRLAMSAFSVLLLDIDHFKQVNDTHGHLLGDRVLKCLCERVAGKLRGSDEIARWGGEEFVVVLPTAHQHNALELAERIRQTVAMAPLEGLAITISIGVAEYVRGESMESLMMRADEALYAAKQGGRNRVRAATQSL